MATTGPLLVFDFDHTITDLNTDVEVQKLAPGGEIPKNSEIRAMYSEKGWTEFMGAVFKLLHENGTTKSAILEVMGGLEFTPNMEELLVDAVEQLGATIIIISDSNSEFIRHILEVRRLGARVERVFTNPGEWRGDLLEIRPYHHQETCSLSTANLCKGQILEEFLAAAPVPFPFVCYVGDGRNDFCPSLRLANRDLVCVREGYSLEKYIPQMEEKGHKIAAEVVKWTDAKTIWSKLVEKLGK